MFERSRTGSVHVIRGDEPLTSPQLETVRRLFDECVQSGQPRIVMDLSRIPLIDSAGLEALLDFQDHCRERGGMMKLASPTLLCRDALTITGVMDRFEVFQDSLAALGSFAK